MPINPITGEEEEEKKSRFQLAPEILEAQAELEEEQEIELAPEILEAQQEIESPIQIAPQPETTPVAEAFGFKNEPEFELAPEILEAQREVEQENSLTFQSLPKEKTTDALTDTASLFRQGNEDFRISEERKAKQRQFLFEEGFTAEEVPQEIFPSKKPTELKTTFERFGDFLFPEESFDPTQEQEALAIREGIAKEQKVWVDETAPQVFGKINKQRVAEGLEPLDLNLDDDRNIFYEELNSEFSARFDNQIETADGWFAILTIPASFWNGAITSIKGSAMLGAQELGGLAIIRELDESIKTRQLPDGSDLMEIGLEALTGAAFGALPGVVGQGISKHKFGRAAARTAKTLTDKTGQKISPSDIVNMTKRYGDQYGMSRDSAMKLITTKAEQSVKNGVPFKFGTAADEIADGGTDLWTMVNAGRIRKDAPKFNEIAGFTQPKFLGKAENKVVGGAPVGGRAAASVTDEQLDFMAKTIVENTDEMELVLPVSKHAFPWRDAKKFYTQAFSDKRYQKIANQMIRNNKVLSDDEAKQVISFKTLAAEANDQDGSLVAKAIYDNILLNDGSSLQAKNVRQAVLHILQSRSTAEDHMANHVMPMARLLKEGKITNQEFGKVFKMNLAILKQADDVSSEIGRALNSMKIETNSIASVQKKIFKQIEDVVDDPVKLEVIARKLSDVDLLDPHQRYKFLMGLRKATTKEQIEEIWFNSILAGPATQFRNIAGNTIFGGIMELERLTGTAIEKGLAGSGRALGLTAAKSSRTFSEAFSAYGSFGRGLADGWDALNQSLRTGVPVFQTTKLSDFSVKTGQSIGGKVGTLINIPSRTLQGADDFFKSIHYRMEIAAGARREALKRGAKLKLTSIEIDNEFKALLENPTDGMRNAAIHRAAVGTFTKEGGKATQAITAVREAMPGGKYVIPFIRTPMNIAGETITRTPIGAVNTLGKLLTRTERMSLREFSDDMAKLFTGGLIGTGMYMLTDKAGIEWNGGGPEQGKERDLFLAQRLPYSFTLPDGTSIGFKNIEPLSGILGIMADLKDIQDNGMENVFTADTVVTISRAISNSVTEKTFGQGFQTLIDVVAPKDKTRTEQLGRKIGRTATGFVPYSGLLRTVDRIYSVDNPRPAEKTSTNIGEALLQETDKITGIKDFFGVELPVPEMENIYTMWGEPIIPGGVLDNAYIDNILLPFRRKDVTPQNHFLNQEIITWVKSRPDADITGLSAPSRTMSFNKVEWELPISEWERFTEIEGQRAKETFLEMFQEPWWAKTSIDNRIKIYNKVRKKIRKQVKLEMIAEGIDGGAENIITLPEQLLGEFKGAPTEAIGERLEEINFD